MLHFFAALIWTTHNFARHKERCTLSWLMIKSMLVFLWAIWNRCLLKIVARPSTHSRSTLFSMVFECFESLPRPPHSAPQNLKDVYSECPLTNAYSSYGKNVAICLNWRFPLTPMCPNEKFTFSLPPLQSEPFPGRFSAFSVPIDRVAVQRENTLHRSHCFRLQLNHRAMEQEKFKKCGRNNKRAAYDGFNNENKYRRYGANRKINQSVDVNGHFNVLGSTMASTLTFRAFKFHLIYILLVLKGFFCPASDWVMRRDPTQCFARRPTHRWLTLIEIKAIHKLAIIFVRMTLEIIHQSISLWRFFWENWLASAHGLCQNWSAQLFCKFLSRCAESKMSSFLLFHEITSHADLHHLVTHKRRKIDWGLTTSKAHLSTRPLVKMPAAPH